MIVELKNVLEMICGLSLLTVSKLLSEMRLQSERKYRLTTSAVLMLF